MPVSNGSATNPSTLENEILIPVQPEIAPSLNSIQSQAFPNSLDKDNSSPDLSVIESIFMNHSYHNSASPSDKALEKPSLIRQFGYSIFEHSIQNSINENLPVPLNYVLGPGDELIIHIWGKLEENFKVTLDKNGKIILPKSGELVLTGLTFEQAQLLITKSLNEYYANIQISVTMGKIRSIVVYVLGDVVRPGSYTLSSLSTAFEALYKAGGPKRSGSMRDIRIIRDKKQSHSIDLYHYLIRGDRNQDPSLKAFDTIFVPPIGKVAKVSGPVKRPGIYEIRSKSKLKDLIYLSGGLVPTTRYNRVQITRVKDNIQNIVLDYDFTSIQDLKKSVGNIPILDGDSLSFYSVNHDIQNYVFIDGHVLFPGKYQFESDMTIHDLIDRAGGLKTDVYRKRANVYSFVTEFQSRLTAVDLTATSNRNFKLSAMDSIKIYSIDSVESIGSVSIAGGVQRPGSYPLFENMRLLDLLFEAQLKSYAYQSDLILTRYDDLGNMTESIINLQNLDLKSTQNVLLKKEDRLFIQEPLSHLEKRFVTLSGEITFPGTYAINHMTTLDDVITLAGGLTPQAFIKGLKLIRPSVLDSLNSKKSMIHSVEDKRLVYDQAELRRQKQLDEPAAAIREKSHSNINQTFSQLDGRILLPISSIDSLKTDAVNIPLLNGDQIIIPKQPATIQFLGGVNQSAALVYNADFRLHEYIDQLGGYTDYADRDRIVIIQPNGMVSKDLHSLGAGDIVYIPEKTISKLDIGQLFQDFLTFTKSLADIALTYVLVSNAINN